LIFDGNETFPPAWVADGALTRSVGGFHVQLRS
jgi:hypothetical protein